MTREILFQNIAELYNLKKYREAKVFIAEAVSLYGESYDSHFFTGVIAFGEKEYRFAVDSLVRAYELNPKDMRTLYNLGMILSKMEQYADAMGWFKKVLDIQPDHVPTLIMVSATFDVTGNPTSSERTCRLILGIDPQNVSAYNNLGNACKNSGKPREAVEAYQKALELKPNMDSIRSNLLFSINYAAQNPEALRMDHEGFASVWDNPIWNHTITPLNGRKLRVGVVSPDFCTHSVAYFLTGLYTHLNRDQFFIASYGNVEHPDDRTEWFESQSDIWLDINETGSREVAQRIKDDHIDILIDLGGHTGGSNLSMFGLKPAPLQVTWLGYPATTGMKTMDYRFTDSDADPVGTEPYYTENLYRLPHFLNYTPRETLPDTNFKATEERDFTLFGSFNNIAKLSPETIELWGAVLHAVPNSKLLIKHKYFNDPGVQTLFLERFHNAGVDASQLIFHAFNFTDKGHMEEYHQIDIALDSYPYNGTTTTFEALIMGVPTLTLTGNVHATRVGTTIMNGMGLPQFVAATPELFVEQAVELSQDREALLTLKKGLREQFMSSPFADSKSFTRSFETALTTIWENSYE